MRIQLAYRVTGEDRSKVVETLKRVCSSIGETGHETYCPILDPSHERMDRKELFEDTLNKLNDADVILVLIKSEDKSEGTLIELGYALAKRKKFILAIKKSVLNTHTRELADKVIEFEDLNELYDKLKRLKIG